MTFTANAKPKANLTYSVRLEMLLKMNVTNMRFKLDILKRLNDFEFVEEQHTSLGDTNIDAEKYLKK